MKSLTKNTSKKNLASYRLLLVLVAVLGLQLGACVGIDDDSDDTGRSESSQTASQNSTDRSDNNSASQTDSNSPTNNNPANPSTSSNPSNSDPVSETPSEPTATGYCPSHTFVGDIGGVQAVATVQWSTEPSFDPRSPILGETYIQVAGEIQSGQFYYTFTAELYGPTGYGDMLDHYDGASFRIQLDVMTDGFYLTANPFGDPAIYAFACQP